MDSYNLFQHTIKGDARQIKSADQQRKDVIRYIDQELEEGSVRNELYDQLVWLKYQIDYSAEGGDLKLLIGDYNWIVDNIYDEYIEEDFDAYEEF